LPEAQYQDESYCCMFVVTSGNVHIFPEFASGQGARVMGCIDFIPFVKWGIENTQGERLLEEHASHFRATGAYGQWL
ncbi:hypothetical protein F5148DRAFT_965391, partial [Russula earlei]